MKFRVGVGKKIGGVYVGASKTIGGGSDGGGGCWLTGLAVLFFPITLMYLFVRWAYRKTQQQKATNPDSLWYRKTWGIILMLILFFPVGIYLMWKYKKSWNLYVKIVVSICVILIFIGAFASQGNNSDDSETSSLGISEAETLQPTESASLTTFMTTALTQAKTTVTTTVITTVKETKPPTEPETEEEIVEVIDEQNEPNEEPEEVIENEPVEEEPAQEEVVEEDPGDSVIVYYTRTGEKYHYENPCGRGTYYECTLSEAERRGLEPCEKCVLH